MSAVSAAAVAFQPEPPTGDVAGAPTTGRSITGRAHRSASKEAMWKRRIVQFVTIIMKSFPQSSQI